MTLFRPQWRCSGLNDALFRPQWRVVQASMKRCSGLNDVLFRPQWRVVQASMTRCSGLNDVVQALMTLSRPQWRVDHITGMEHWKFCWRKFMWVVVSSWCLSYSILLVDEFPSCTQMDPDIRDPDKRKNLRVRTCFFYSQSCSYVKACTRIKKTRIYEHTHFWTWPYKRLRL